MNDAIKNPKVIVVQDVLHTVIVIETVSLLQINHNVVTLCLKGSSYPVHLYFLQNVSEVPNWQISIDTLDGLKAHTCYLELLRLMQHYA